MRNYIISLERATDRRQAISKCFDQNGLPFEWVNGYDWKSLTDEQLAVVDADSLVREGRPALQLGEIGCMLSHREAMRRITMSEDRMGAVFEDDIELEDSAVQVLADIESSDIDFDLIFLHRRADESRFVPIKPLSPTHALGIVKHKDMGTLAYVITRSAAERYLRSHPYIVHHADHALQAYWVSGLKSYTLNPPAVTFEYTLETSIRMESPMPKRSRSLATGIFRVRRQIRELWMRRAAFKERLLERGPSVQP